MPTDLWGNICDNETASCRPENKIGLNSTAILRAKGFFRRIVWCRHYNWFHNTQYIINTIIDSTIHNKHYNWFHNITLACVYRYVYHFIDENVLVLQGRKPEERLACSHSSWNILNEQM